MGNGKLPNFLVIGSTRCGTTMIHECLKEHPEIYVPPHIWKEVHFFGRETNYIKGLEYYKSFFRFITNEHIYGEVTPNYLYSYKCKERIASDLDRDTIKLIISVRNPIDMVYSHYRHDYRSHSYDRFSEYIRSADLIIRRGFYIDYIEGYMTLFPRQNFHIVVFDDFLENPRTFIRSIYNFLGTKDEAFLPSSIEKRINSSPKKKFRLKSAEYLTKKMLLLNLVRKIPYYHFLGNIYRKIMAHDFDRITEEDYSVLKEIFEPYNQRLFHLLGRDLNW